MGVWQSFHRRDSARTERSTRRSASRRGKLGKIDRGAARRLEALESRLLLTSGPQLISIIPNDGSVLLGNATLHTAPTQLTFRFLLSASEKLDPNTLTGIQLARSGSDGVFSNGNDINVTPGYIGIDPAQPNQVVMRFSSPLPDDLYRITVVGTGAGALKDTDSPALAFNGGQNYSQDFRLQLGPQVLSVVPQPVTRDSNGVLVSHNNEIDVYFDQPLQTMPGDPAHLNPQQFELIATKNTATTADDAVYVADPGASFIFFSGADGTTHVPGSVAYDAQNNEARILFQVGALPFDLNALGSGTGAFRLRIGNTDVPSTTPNTIPGTTAATDGTFANATELPGSPVGGLPNPLPSTQQTQIFSGNVTQQSIISGLVFPGGLADPGHRSIPISDENHVGGVVAGSAHQYTYGFPDVYGNDPSSGQQLHNQITANEKQTVREIFQLYSYYTGLNFVEVSGAGDFNVAVGDPRAVDKTVPPSVGGISGGSLAVINGNLNWGPALYGSGFMSVAMHEIGHSLGLPHDDNSPPDTVMNGGAEANQAGGGAQGLFPGVADITNLQFTYEPTSNQIDLYKFTIDSAGTLNAETQAQRLPGVSSLNTLLTLYEEFNDLNLAPSGAQAVNHDTFTIRDNTGKTVTFEFTTQSVAPGSTLGDGNIAVPFTASSTQQDLAVSIVSAIQTQGLNVTATIATGIVRLAGPVTVTATGTTATPSLTRQEIGRNNDYYGTDSFASLSVQPGIYYAVVTASGNDQFDPNVAYSGWGGNTSGQYKLLLNFQPEAATPLTNPGLSLFVPAGGASAFPSNGQANYPYSFTLTDVDTGSGQPVTETITFYNGSTAPANTLHHINVQLQAADTQETVTQSLLLALQQAIAEGNFNLNNYILANIGNGRLEVGGGPTTSIVVDPQGKGNLTGSSGDPFPLVLWGSTQRDPLVGNSGAGGTGAYNFWFNVGPTIYVDKAAPAGGAGTLAAPYNTIQAALVDPNVTGAGGAGQQVNVRVEPNAHATLAIASSANGIAVGQTFQVVAGPYTFNFEFVANGAAADGSRLPDNNFAVSVGNGQSSQIALHLEAALNNATLTLPTGRQVKLAAADGGGVTVTHGIDGAASSNSDGNYYYVYLFQGAQPVTVNKQTTPFSKTIAGVTPPTINNNNLSYLVGTDQFGALLPDDSPANSILQLPKNVVLMVDAGAVFKLRQANIEAGSSAVNIDQSQSALQALGVPGQQVVFTSYNDDTPSLGAPQNHPGVAKAPGDWGGLVFNNDSDLETLGIFLNSVNEATINYGGGRVVVNGVPDNYDSIYLNTARPAITNDLIINGAGAAISGNPNSFENTRFGSDLTIAIAGIPADGQQFTLGTVKFQITTTGTVTPGYIPISIAGMTTTAQVAGAVKAAINQNLYGTAVDQAEALGNVVTLPANIAVNGLSLAGPLFLGTLHFIPELFSADDQRFGPDVHGNLLTTGPASAARFNNPNAPSQQLGVSYVGAAQDTINGILVRINTNAGQSLDTLDVSAVFAATDIPYVLQENLVITGNTGGNMLVNGIAVARIAGQLLVEPGVLVKLGGSRIEAQPGANVIAEGTAAQPIVFTSIDDARYGGGGTFDTSNSSATVAPKAGDWGGFYFWPTSTGSFDETLITFGGGASAIEGGFANFDAIEIHQAKVRIADSTLENNASGADGSNRNGRLSNDAATIFALGAQPVIVNNVIQNNAGAAVSSDVDALSTQLVLDWGRSTGAVSRYGQFDDNHGPLVRLNKIGGNGTNGMVVRGGILETASIWDDVDIVHVVEGNVTVPNFQSVGGLRIQSSPTQSLVIKMTAGAGFNASGSPGDISDRIGGEIQILGTPNHPVVITSIKDDTVGAGLTPTNQPDNDTNGDGSATSPTPGDWNSVLFDQYSNDRNVAMINEAEPALTGGLGKNELPPTSQSLGQLAPNQQSGDDNLRLGFQVNGSVSPDHPQDVDTYTFKATAGTQVFFSVTNTSPALDAVLELVDANGNVLARSDQAEFEQQDAGFNGDPLQAGPLLTGLSPNNLAQPLQASTTGVAGMGLENFWSTNRYDPAFRVTLPGSAGVNNYYIRVYAKGPTDSGGNPIAGVTYMPNIGSTSATSHGLAGGQYQLQVRLQQMVEIPGSTVQNADIRFATNGIDVEGLPAHSPLISTSSAGPGVATTSGANLGTGVPAQNLGDLITSDTSSLNTAGYLSDLTSVQWYKFNLTYAQIQAIGGFSGGAKTWSTVFDVGYADGLTRPDTEIDVYDANGNLIYVGRDSNVADQQPQPGAGLDSGDLTHSSFGQLDPYIGPVQLQTGIPGSTMTYYVAVHSSSVLPSALDATFNGAATDYLVRLEPVDSLNRVTEDHIGSVGGSTAQDPSTLTPLFGNTTGNAAKPLNPAGDYTVAANTNGIVNAGYQQLNSYATPFNLADLVLYVTATASDNRTHLYTYNPFTGDRETDQGAISPQSNNSLGMNNIAMRNDGQLYGMETGLSDGSTNLVQINTGTPGSSTIVGNTGIVTYYDDPGSTTQPNITAANAGIQFDAETFVQNGTTRTLYAIGHRDSFHSNLVTGPTNPQYKNLLYQLDPNTGAVTRTFLSTAPQWNNPLPNNIGDGAAAANITGLAWINNKLYAVTDAGGLYTISGVGPTNTINNPTTATLTYVTTITDPVSGLPIAFHGLTAGPTNVENSAYGKTLFATSESGKMYAIDVDSASATYLQLRSVFHDPADSNAASRQPWIQLNVSAGASLYNNIGLAFSTLDYNLWHVTNTNADANQGINVTNDQSRNSLSANKPPANGNSFYFGLESVNSVTNTPQNVLPASSAYYSTATYAGGTTPYNSYNLPGGAYGSLTTNTFSLSGYNTAEKPTLYFDYYLDAGGNPSISNAAPTAFSSARVFISPDGGQTWDLVATNNTRLAAAPSPGFDPTSELANYISTSENTGSGDVRQQVQPLWDSKSTNTGWRQARIDLSAYAGKSNLELRFDFSTAGTTRNPGSPGNYSQNDVTSGNDSLGHANSFGNFLSAGRGQNLNHGGWYVDAITVGFAGKGEMVTGVQGTATSNTGYFNVPTNQDPKAIKPITSGPYELEIRRGAEFGANVNEIKSDISLGQSFSINDRLDSSFSLNTDFTQTPLPTVSAANANWNFTGLAPTVDGQGILSLTMNVQTTAEPSTVLASPSKLEVQIPAIGFDQFITVNAPSTGQPKGQRVTQRFVLSAAQMATLTALGGFSLSVTPVSNVDTDQLGIVSASATLDYMPFAGGDQFMIDDGKNKRTFEFTSSFPSGTGLADGNVAVFFNTSSSTPNVMAQQIAAAINAVYNVNTFNVSASLSGTGDNGSTGIIHLFGAANVVNGGPAAGAFGTVHRLDDNYFGPGSLSGQNTFVIQYDIFLSDQFTPNFGDTNMPRPQGAVILYGNQISNSQNNGILVQAAPRGELVGPSVSFSGGGGSGATGTAIVNGQGQITGINITSGGSGYTSAPTVSVSGGGNGAVLGAAVISGGKVISVPVINGGANYLAGDNNTSFPHQGAVVNTPTLNSDRLAPGVTIINNLIYGVSASGSGITFAGDANVSGPLAAVPFGRIVNNTIYGGYTASGNAPVGVGINVANNASPTMLNNILASLQTGIRIDASSQALPSPPVLGENIYQNNGSNANVALGSFNVQLQPTDALFITPSTNPGLANFYLKEYSQAIDSSINSLQDRAEMTAVTGPLAIAPSPIIAPSLDVYGQLRVPDPNVSSFPGLGNNVFIDRGAVERVDNPSVGLTSALLAPVDNGASDLNPSPNVAFIRGQSLSEFTLQLNDGAGPGVYDASVLPYAYVQVGAGATGTSIAGNTITVTVGGTTKTFEFTTSTLPPGDTNTPIVVSAGDSPATLAADAAQTISATLGFATANWQSSYGARIRFAPGATAAASGAQLTAGTSNTLDIVEDGKLLTAGVDYFFNYDNNNHIIHLVAASGVWLNGHQYDIFLDNGNKFDPFNPSSMSLGITDRAGNDLQANEASGYTHYRLLLANNSNLAPTIALATSGALPLTVFENNATHPNSAAFSWTTPFSTINSASAAISILDIDSNGGSETLTLQASHGTLSLSPDALAELASLGVTPGNGISGNGTATLAITAPLGEVDAYATTPGIIAALGGLIFTPDSDFDSHLGTQAVITATINDNGNTPAPALSNAITIPINVIAINDAPSFNEGANQTVNEDAGPQSVAGWATSISAGPNEGDQTLTFQVSNNNNGLFSTQPTIDPITGTLTYTPAANANGVATVTVYLHDNGGTAYGGVDTSAVQTFTITVNPVNDAPSFTPGGNQTVNEDAGPQSVVGWASGISAGPPDEAGQTVNFLVTNDNNSLFSAQPALDATGKLAYTPAANAYGVATVTVYLHDNGGTGNGGVDTSAPVTFTITVNPVNDAPIFTKGADQTVFEDAGAQTVTPWATGISPGPNEATQTLNFLISSSNPALFSAGPAIDPITGTLTYAAAPNAYGTATVTVRLHDDGGTANGGVDTSAAQTFTITINPINDAPSFTKGADQVVNEDAGPQTAAGWATGISAGPNEASQTLTFLISSDNPALFAAGPSIDPLTGKLSYTTAPNANGAAHVTVQLQDNGGTANGGVDTSAAQTFTITVNPVNDAPSFTAGADQTINEDAGPQTVPSWATSISFGPANETGQTLNFLISSDNPSLFSVAPSIDLLTGTLTYAPAANAYGVAHVSVQLHDDGGTANGGVDTSPVTVLTITVNAVNDVPTFTKGADQNVLEDAGPQTVAGWATGISAGPNEASQTLNFLVSSDNPSLFSAGPAIDPLTGNLTYAPAANAYGTATVTVQLRDNGGTANGGVDTSAAQTFTITITPVNDAPTFTPGANQTVLEDAGAQTVAAWATAISDGPNESGQALNFLVSNNNNSLFSVQPSIDATGKLTYTPAANAYGTATVTVQLHDDGGTANGGADTSTAKTFTISVTPVNDAPTFTAGADQTINENVGPQTVASWATNISPGPNEAGQTLNFLVSVDNPSLFSAGPSIDVATGTLTYTPALNISGVAYVTVTLQDNGGTANGGVNFSTQTFKITVNFVNHAPSFVKGPDQTVNEDAPLQTIANWATNLNPGPDPIEAFEQLDFIVATNNNALFSTLPAIDSSGKLTYQPAPNVNGTATVTVYLHDDGGTANGGVDTSAPQTFVITVNSVNDVPAFTAGGNQTVNEDAGPQTVSGWATNISAGPNEGSQTLNFLVSASNSSLFSAQPAIDASGNLTYTPAPNANGTSTVTVYLHDNGGTANGGVDTSAPQTFTITVNPVNDAPSFTGTGNQVLNQNSGQEITVIWATNIKAGPLNEAGQALNFVVSNDNPTLFSEQPSIDPNGILTYRAQPFVHGSATVTVYLHDNGGTANGGVDTSATQTFTITVNQVNQAPSFTSGGNQTVNEDAGAQTVPGWATSISAGPNEGSQTLNFLVSNNNPGLFSTAPSVDPATGTLTYTPAANAYGTATVTVTLKDDGGTANGGVDSFTQTFTITINPVNDAPAFTSGGNQTVNEDAGAQSVLGWATGISAGPPNESSQAFNFLVTSDNPSLFSVAPAVNAGSGTLTYTPAANAYGSATVTVTLKDNGGTANGGVDSLTQTFVITVNPVNDAPSFTAGGNRTVLEDAGPQTVSAWATNISAGPNESGQTLNFVATTNNPGLFAVAPAIDPISGNLTYTTAANAYGSATVTVTLHDDGGTANGGVDASTAKTFTITVTPVNDAPSFTGGGDQTVNQDAGPQTATGWATNISDGPNETGQALTFLVSNTNTSLFSVAPAIDPGTGTLTYTFAPHAFGQSVVTVQLRDSGGTANGGVNVSATQTFTITANFVNQAPSFTAGSNQTVNENAGPQAVAAWAKSINQGAFESGQALNFIVTSDNPGLFSAGPAIDPATGKLTYTPAADMSGTATVTVQLHDNAGTANGGVDTSPAQTFTITVNLINHAPSFTLVTPVTVDQDSPAQSIANVATNISAGPNEQSQNLNFIVTTDNPSLFSVAPALDANGTLTFTPAANKRGTANVTVKLHDDGGTARGGVDTSAPQTFQIVLNPVNHAPTVVAQIANRTLNENAADVTFSVANVFDDLDLINGDHLALSLTNDNPGLLGATLAGGTLTLHLQPNQFGAAHFDLQAADDLGLTVHEPFTVNVNAVNQAPSFTRGGDLRVATGSGAFAQPGWATNLSAGPANEAGQTLSFQVTGDSNPALFLAAPSVSSSGALSFTPAPGVSGTATITLVLKDSGDTANGGVNTSAPQTFRITVNAAPVANPDTIVLSDTSSSSATASVGVLTNDTDANGDPLTAIIVSGPAHGTLSLNPDGSFTYVKGADFAGLDYFTYRASDGLANSGNVTVRVLSYQASIVDKLYQQVLHRSPDDNGLTYWTNRIMNGDPYSVVAQGIFESNERLDPIIQQYYQDYLLRPADAAGLAYWRDKVWKRDGGPENVVAGMISSAEFFQSAGGTNAAWVGALYERLLHRPADPSGLSYWTTQLNLHLATQQQVVLGFVRSDENFQNLISGFYQQYLQRNPTASELNAKLQEMRNGASQRDIQIEIINSQEYRNTPPPPASGLTGRLLS